MSELVTVGRHAHSFLYSQRQSVVGGLEIVSSQNPTIPMGVIIPLYDRGTRVSQNSGASTPSRERKTLPDEREAQP